MELRESDITCFVYHKDRILQRIAISEVLFLEASDNYVKFHTAKFYYLVRATLTAALHILPENQFVQIHRSLAISVDQLDTIAKEFVTLRSLPDRQLSVSKKFYPALIDRLKIVQDTM